MSKTFQVSTSSTMGHGGGTIKRQELCALLLVVGMAVGICPSVAGASDQNASDNNAQIGLIQHTNVLEVNAASSVKVKVWYKHWYKSYGKWKYTWKYTWKYYYKYASKAKAASSYSGSHVKSSDKADTFSDPTLNSIMKSGSKYGYSHSYHTGEDLVKHGCGDCWAFSDYLNTKFKSAGYKSRVVQYATNYSSRHRSVQLYQDGEWKIVPYRAYGYNYLIV
ncbi:hypothetical protein [Methanobacterium sp.]|uniref:hypothetical protein n=1 Tax=Methanobacterium sp. TaxID=2164 RepID=UPI003C75738E